MSTIDVPSKGKNAKRALAAKLAEVEHALRLSQMELSAKDEIIAALRDALGMFQRRDQLAAALDTADLQRLTNDSKHSPAAAVSRSS